MYTAKMTSKGQITLPKPVRQKLGLKTGDRIGFVEEKGVFLVRRPLKKSALDKWVGKLKGKGTPVDQIIEELRGK
jgi:AbrB family looped-hinge helix DNA binding protein